MGLGPTRCDILSQRNRVDRLVCSVTLRTITNTAACESVRDVPAILDQDVPVLGQVVLVCAFLLSRVQGYMEQT